MSVLYATGLANGTTYYVQVGSFGPGDAGTFCLAIDELGSSMLSTTNTCGSFYQTPGGTNTTYTGWVSIVDNSSNLVALVKNPAGGSVSDYTAAQNVAAGAVRSTTSTGTVPAQYYLNRNFRISNSSATNVQVQLFFLESERAALAAAQPAATLNGLTITHQSGSTCDADFTEASGTRTLINQTGSGQSTDGLVDWISFTTPGFSQFFVSAGSTIPLPVTLKDIAAQNEGAVNRITWTTAMETEGISFELQHSTNGSDFMKIADVQGKGKAGAYVYTDTKPASGMNYYRLNLKEANGSSTLSKTVTAFVNGKDAFAMNAFPNPAKDQLTVQVYGTTDGKAQVQLTDIAGKMLKAAAISDNKAIFNLNDLPGGLYFVKYTDGTRTEMIKVNKQ